MILLVVLLGDVIGALFVTVYAGKFYNWAKPKELTTSSVVKVPNNGM